MIQVVETEVEIRMRKITRSPVFLDNDMTVRTEVKEGITGTGRHRERVWGTEGGKRDLDLFPKCD